MGNNHELTTLSEVMESLRKKGIDQEFLYTKGYLQIGNSPLYSPSELQIIKSYRFEGKTDPGDSSVLYLIKSMNGFTGFIIDSYGVYSNQENNEFNNLIRQIPVLDHHDEVLFTL